MTLARLRQRVRSSLRTGRAWTIFWGAGRETLARRIGWWTGQMIWRSGIEARDFRGDAHGPERLRMSRFMILDVVLTSHNVRAMFMLVLYISFDFHQRALQGSYELDHSYMIYDDGYDCWERHPESLGRSQNGLSLQ